MRGFSKGRVDIWVGGRPWSPDQQVLSQPVPGQPAPCATHSWSECLASDFLPWPPPLHFLSLAASCRDRGPVPGPGPLRGRSRRACSGDHGVPGGHHTFTAGQASAGQHRGRKGQQGRGRGRLLRKRGRGGSCQVRQAPHSWLRRPADSAGRRSRPLTRRAICFVCHSPSRQRSQQRQRQSQP